MPIAAGSLVDDFVLPDEQGRPRRLSELLRTGPVVLFFYPAAFTPGCTAQACHFRDVAGELAAQGAQPVGVSADSVTRQRWFASPHRLSFPLLSDADGTVAAAFGVRRTWLAGLAPVKRSTFVIGTDRRVVGVFTSETDMNAHADRALALLRTGRAVDAG